MAHSNRKKLREARGGLTRNQQRKAKKAQNSAGQSNRLAETVKWVAFNEEQRRLGVKKEEKTGTGPKVKKFNRQSRAVERRKGALKRLEFRFQIRDEAMKLTQAQLDRIQKEMATLKARI